MSTPSTFNQGLYSAIKSNFTEFQGVNAQSTSFYKVFNIQTFNALAPPYCTFCRHTRTHEKDLDNKDTVWIDKMTIKIYHNDSMALETLQQKMRTFLEAQYKSTIGGKYIQKICVEDDYQQEFVDAEKGLFLYEGVLEFEVIYQP